MRSALPPRRALLALAGARGVLALVAIPLAPALFHGAFLLLVLLRPTKEVLLAGGFQLRRGAVELPHLVLAAVPLAILGVWLMYWLGRAFSEELTSGDPLPGVASRLLPPERIARLCRVLERKGGPVILLGRLAAFPSSLLAAAAGASGMAPRRFLVADALGGALSVAEVVAAGYLVGEAYERAGPWVTAAGLAVLVALLVLVGRWLQREGEAVVHGAGT